MAVGIKLQEIPRRRDANHSPWHTLSDRYGSLQIHLQSLPGAAAQLREQFAVVEKVSLKDFNMLRQKKKAVSLHDMPILVYWVGFVDRFVIGSHSNRGFVS